MGRRKKPDAEVKPHAQGIVVAARIDDLVRIILDGAQFWDVREFVRQAEADPASNWTLKEGFLPLSEKTLREYKSRAERVIRASREKDREKLIDFGLAKRLNFCAKAVVAGDLRTALACQMDHDKLAGLYPTDKLPPSADARPITFILVEAPHVSRAAPLPVQTIEAATDRGVREGGRTCIEVSPSSRTDEGVE